MSRSLFFINIVTSPYQHAPEWLRNQIGSLTIDGPQLAALAWPSWPQNASIWEIKLGNDVLFIHCPSAKQRRNSMFKYGGGWDNYSK